MYAVLRLFISLGLLALGWGIIIFSLVGVFWFVWDYFSGINFLTEAVPPPIPLAALLAFTSWIPFVLLIVFLLLFMFLPARWVMEVFVHKTIHEQIPKEHTVALEVKKLADEMGIEAPKIYIYENETPGAWAYATFWGAIIGVSHGLLITLGRDQIRWVIAHELAHIRNFDAGTGAFWVSVVKVQHFAWAIHRFVINFCLLGAQGLQLHLVLVAIISMPILLVSYLAIVADYISKKLFLIVDRYIGRQMEYRADAIASEYVHPTHGIEVLAKISNGIEPGFGMFASHPSTIKRISRLQKLQMQTATT